MHAKHKQLFDPVLIRQAIRESFRKLDPRAQWQNPVMLVTEVVAGLCTLVLIRDVFSLSLSWFTVQITAWLWLTVLFANFAEALAEGRGKAHADTLRKTRTQTIARRIKDEREERVKAGELKREDLVICETGDVIPSDGEVVEGIASVDESAITGESAPVIRESGGDRSAVTGGTKVLSDRIVIRVTCEQGNTFMDRMIALVENASRRKTPNEIALGLLLTGMTVVFLVAVCTLPAFGRYSEHAAGQQNAVRLNLPVLAALLVCLIPTTIGALLSAIGISGIDRLMRRNVLVTSGRAVESAGNIDVLLLDKTGTVTLGSRMATAFTPAHGVSVEHLADMAQLASLSDETPEGRSIVVLAKRDFMLRGRDIAPAHMHFVPFTAQTRMSGVDIPADDDHSARCIRKGSADAIRLHVDKMGGIFPEEVAGIVRDISRNGSTPLVVSDDRTILGVIELKDVVKGGIKDRFAELRRMGIRTVMVTGDNALTASAIAAEAGVDDYMAQATPEQKLNRIREEQAAGHLVAMTGDGTNDAPALAQADVAVAMNSGTQAAREAGNMVDLDSNPTKLIDIVETGKQLLMTRGALTTFSIANDASKYFAILPAMFGGLYAGTGLVGPLAKLNIMRLVSPESAILSAVIFNALIIVALIPLALRGIRYRPMGASAILKRNLLIYGVGGLIAPFIGIKLIDITVNWMRLI